ncbi:MAG: CCA tRNA nucleotidyltransferase, partial [Acetobacter sp.]
MKPPASVGVAAGVAVDILAGLTDGQRHGLERLWTVLPQARLVGGAVRDLLLRMPVADVDMAVPQPPDDVMAVLRAAGLRVEATGLAHGTVTAVLDGTPYEITTLRRDVLTDGRHAVVRWTDDWREDAARRDFTINAMTLDRHGLLHDYFGGQADLNRGRVRFVGDATLRITEDALRILRFFRFQGRYGHGQPDGEAVGAIASSTALLRGLSVERVWSELRRILAGPNVAAVVALMAQTGVLAELLPEGVEQGRFERLLGLGAPCSALLRLAALARQPLEVARRLRLSRADTAYLRGVG